MPGKGPLEWAREAQHVGVFTPPPMRVAVSGAEGQGGGGSDLGEDPEERLERMEREFDLQQAAHALNTERRLTRELRLVELQGRLREARDRLDGNGQAPAGADTPGDIVQGLLTQFNTERQAMMGELRALQQQLIATGQTAAEQRLRDMEARLNSVANAPVQGGGNPVNQLIESIKAARELREAVDSAMPPAPAADPGLTASQAIEQDRIREESAIRRMDSEARLEEIRANREKVRLEAETREGRIDKVLGTLDHALAPLIGQFAGNGMAGMMGGAGSNGGGGGGAPAPAAGPTLLPWGCPNCRQTNYAAPGTANAVCPQCKLFVNLTPQ